MKEITNRVAYESIPKSGKVLLVFSAPWCGHCVHFKPVLKSFEEKYPNSVDINIIDIDDLEDVAEKYDIMSIPSIVLLENGRATKRHVGGLSVEEMTGFVGIQDKH